MNRMLSTLAFFLVSLAAECYTQAGVFFDSTNGLTATLDSPGVSTSLATGPKGVTFTVGGSDITLDSAVLGLYGNGAGTANVGLRLYAGTSLSSASQLQEVTATPITLNTLASGGTTYTFNTGGWTLAANTQYSLAAYYVSGGTITPRLAATAVLPSNFTTNGLTFDSFTVGEELYMQLNGTTGGGGASVPEPSTSVLLGLLGVAGIVRNRRLRRKSVATAPV